jgi:hypothetical protein
LEEMVTESPHLRKWGLSSSTAYQTRTLTTRIRFNGMS